MSVLGSIGLGDKSLIQKWLIKHTASGGLHISEKDLSIQVDLGEVSEKYLHEHYLLLPNGEWKYKNNLSRVKCPVGLDIDSIEDVPSYIKFSKNIELYVLPYSSSLKYNINTYPNLFVDTIETKVEIV